MGAVLEDFADELVTRDGARRDYGVALADTGVVDEAVTSRLRAARKRA
ncbi:MAG: hypothetical protein HYY79_00660 [Betaproteobacteria bacterium]|nr:hypothetical protein [Betaproteobacteria bacterium]